MQNDLISRSALEKAMRFVTDDTTCPMHIAAEIDQIIDCAPAVDAVEVVRCKDCKYWTRDGNGYCDDESYCNNPFGLDDIAMPDNFCSYGERRADDGK